MEIEGEILGFVLIFLAISAAFYFFIISDWGDDEPEVNLPDGSGVEPAGQGNIVNETVGNGSLVDQTLGNGTVGNETNVTFSFGGVEELHWGHRDLTYRFVNNVSECEGAPIVKMGEAFNIISEASGGNINFTEVSGNESEDINVTCVNRLELLEELEDYEVCEDVSLDYRSVQFSGYEVLTDGKYVTSLTLIMRNDTSNVYRLCYVTVASASVSFDWDLLLEAKPKVVGGVIVSAKKTIYTTDSEYPYCIGFPAKEVHDVMHLLGVGHSETPVFHDHYGWYSKDLRYFKDTMFPYPYCTYITELNPNYADCLKYIYSGGVEGEGCVAVNFIS
ncbi:MAG: hypothetical protein ABH864_05125 [archaeon]